MLGTPRIPKRPFRGDWYAGRRPSQPCIQEQTPPPSDLGSPQVKVERTEFSFQEQPKPRILRYPTFPQSEGPCTRLPSLEEFDKGVEALVRAHGPIETRISRYPVPRSSHDSDILESTEHVHEPRLSWLPGHRPARGLTSGYFPSGHMAINSFNKKMLDRDQAFSHTSSQDSDSYYDQSPDDHLGPRLLPAKNFYRSPSPEGKTHHINQQYTVEEGDFIIYCRHDKAMKWSDIEEEFAFCFGHTPKRTVQGLQAWHYRMNKYIPVWDEDGWLCFDSEDDLEPRLTSVKCRSRNDKSKPKALSGIAERYPERAVTYAWVDTETKLKSRDWAAKRTLQFEIRRMRRRESSSTG
ncbi:hypothetical protein NW762_014571 [Fusarium torreyae]|uniref:Uncharacterized protein n=1 Tax=Fusarium torreyae TaxID=1237075 RepID=A0A9W8RLX5_9HYPO|nr:hypothetical protein NW762_014571 [Fusarium torreyae]